MTLVDKTKAMKGPTSNRMLSSNAQVLELADKQDLGSCASGREGSTPSLGTSHIVSVRSEKSTDVSKSPVKQGIVASVWSLVALDGST